MASLVGVFDAAVNEIVFRKKPEARLSDPEYLKRFVGAYDLVGQRAVVSLKGNILTVTLPGQPELELVPDLGGEFVLKEARIVSVRFLAGPDGAVTGLEFIQPDKESTRQRKQNKTGSAHSSETGPPYGSTTRDARTSSSRAAAFRPSARTTQTSTPFRKTAADLSRRPPSRLRIRPPGPSLSVLP